MSANLSRTIERNLDSICKTPRIHREELLRFVHRPILVHQMFEASCLHPFRMLQDLTDLYHGINIYDDPCVKKLLADGGTSSPQLQKVVTRRKTACQDQLKSFVETSWKIYEELGTWACEMYIYCCIKYFASKQQDYVFYSDSLSRDEASYLLSILKTLNLSMDYANQDPQPHSITPKAEVLINTLLAEAGIPRETKLLEEQQTATQAFSGIIFVETRAAVIMLKKLLQAHPSTKNRLILGASVGTSTSSQRKAKISDCLANSELDEELEIILDDLRVGKRNLLVSTNVVEEGIDITACNTVICFDEPKSLVSFIQRRGRARDIKSKYIIMFPKQEKTSGLPKWAHLEEAMKEKYMDDMRELERIDKREELLRTHREFTVEATG
jgi:hypothetical protein